jgi:phospholipase C
MSRRRLEVLLAKLPERRFFRGEIHLLDFLRGAKKLNHQLRRQTMPAKSKLAGQIDHVVIIVKENHSFDNYFGTFPGAEGIKLPPAKNPPPDDPIHRHEKWEQRATDTVHQVQYVEADIPSYFALARQYTLCDHYFSEVAGPSTPNHLMLICADAPIINNPHNHYRPSPQDNYDLRSLPLALERAGKTWANYGGYPFHYIKELAGHRFNHNSELFIHHATAGQLPSVSWLYAEGKPSLSEHPKQNVTEGAQWTRDQIQAIVDGGLWERTVVFVTWDDWGGWSDHVTPDNVEQWDASKAQRAEDAHPEFNGQQFRYGSRVPCLVISPYAKKAHISKTKRSHISLVKFVETLWGIPSIHPRLKKADNMMDCFNPKQKPLPPPKP